VHKRRGGSIKLKIGNIPGDLMHISLSVSNNTDGSCVRFFWKGDCVDDLFWHEAYAQKTFNGFVCTECKAEGESQIFASKKELWIDRIFKPLLKTDNKTIACADYIDFHVSPSGSS
jgi:hypothetical protein